MVRSHGRHRRYVTSVLLVVASSFVAGSLAATVLRQEDFDAGAVIISQPGLYELGEDIEFLPTSNVYPLTAEQPEMYLFPEAAPLPSFRLGHFAALVIAADDVTLDLKGHTIKQSAAHANVQRFFSVLELANSPFPPNKGPAAFGGASTFKAARNVVIKNGKIGRSAHHGIHGNKNVNVQLLDLDITDFEVAGVSLNGADQVLMKNVEVHHQRADVAFSGRFSASIFLLQALSRHLGIDDDTENWVPSMADVKAKMTALRTHVHQGLANGSSTLPLFASTTSGIPDGSFLGGIVFHPDLNIGGIKHEFSGDPTEGLVLEDLNIHDIQVNPLETAALVTRGDQTNLTAAGDFYTKGKHVHDMVAAVFDIDHCVNTTAGYVYSPNPLADLQLAVAAYKLECYKSLDCPHRNNTAARALLDRHTIGEQVVQWAKGEKTWAEMMESYDIQGSHDVMFHTIKGIIGLKIDGALGVQAERVQISSIVNVADQRSRSPMAFEANRHYQYQGYFARGVSIASSVKVDMEKFMISDLTSDQVPEVACDLIGDVEDVTTDKFHTQSTKHSKVQVDKVFAAQEEQDNSNNQENESQVLEFNTATIIAVGGAATVGALMSLGGVWLMRKKSHQKAGEISIIDSKDKDLIAIATPEI